MQHSGTLNFCITETVPSDLIRHVYLATNRRKAGTQVKYYYSYAFVL